MAGLDSGVCLRRPDKATPDEIVSPRLCMHPPLPVSLVGGVGTEDDEKAKALASA